MVVGYVVVALSGFVHPEHCYCQLLLLGTMQVHWEAISFPAIPRTGPVPCYREIYMYTHCECWLGEFASAIGLTDNWTRLFAADSYQPATHGE